MHCLNFFGSSKFACSCRYLIEKEANVTAVNSEGEVPLDIAEEDDMINFLQEEIDNRGEDQKTELEF